MSKWTFEIRFVDCCGCGFKPEPITRVEEESTEVIIALAKLGGGQIEYDGYNAYVCKPVVDPVRRKLWYTIEIYGEVER